MSRTRFPGEKNSGTYHCGNKGKIWIPQEHLFSTHDGKHYDRSNPKYQKLKTKLKEVINKSWQM